MLFCFQYLINYIFLQFQFPKHQTNKIDLLLLQSIVLRYLYLFIPSFLHKSPDSRQLSWLKRLSSNPTGSNIFVFIFQFLYFMLFCFKYLIFIYSYNLNFQNNYYYKVLFWDTYIFLFHPPLTPLGCPDSSVG